MRRIAPALLLVLALPFLAACGRSDAAEPGGAPANRLLSVRIYATGSSTPNVLVNVPLSVVSTAVRIASIARALGARIEIADPEYGHRRIVRLDDLDLDALIEAIRMAQPGPVLQVEREGGERLEIWIR